MKRILITGANSYIGTFFEGFVTSGKYIDKYKVETLDMQNDKWEKYDFSRYDVVFHVAGIAHSDVGNASEETKALYYKVNRDLAVKTAKKAKESGVKQFIFMSSMIVYGGAKHITIDTEPKPANFYGDSKWQADREVRKLESDNFKVVVLRPPMIYGNGSKGNYPVLANLAKKLPIFPKVNNKRSMLYIENLCEFIRLMIDNEERGIFFPQNNELVNTSEMVKEIARICKHKIWVTNLLAPFVALGKLVPGKIGNLCNKAFGSSYYELEMSAYKQNYRIATLSDSIMSTESVKDKHIYQKRNTQKVVLVNCFDTYRAREEAVNDFLKKNSFDVTVLTADFSHLSKQKREEKKEDYIYVETKPYNRNLSVARLYSHYAFSKSVVKEIDKLKPDLVYVMIPPNSLVKKVSRYKKNKPLKLIFDVIDLWPETMPINKFKNTLPFSMWKNLRHKYIHNADYVVTECNLFEKYMPECVCKTIYWPKDISPMSYEAKHTEGKINLLYLGSVNNIIDVDLICQLIKGLKTHREVCVKIIGNGENKSSFIDRLEASGARVEDYGVVFDEKKKIEVAHSCDFGLNIYKDSTCIGLTMKSIDYFSYALPVINNIKGDTFDIVKNNCLGVNITNSINEQVITEIEEFMKNNKSFHNKLAMEQFSREGFEQKMKAVFEELGICF